MEWDDIICDVDAVSEVSVVHAGQNFILRTETSGAVGKAFQTAGVALPPVLREVPKRCTTPEPCP